jgi:hypothetical protein
METFDGDVNRRLVGLKQGFLQGGEAQLIQDVPGNRIVDSRSIPIQRRLNRAPHHTARDPFHGTVHRMNARRMKTRSLDRNVHLGMSHTGPLTGLMHPSVDHEFGSRAGPFVQVSLSKVKPDELHGSALHLQEDAV